MQSKKENVKKLVALAKEVEVEAAGKIPNQQRVQTQNPRRKTIQTRKQKKILVWLELTNKNCLN